jgi:hypothetical protein
VSGFALQAAYYWVEAFRMTIMQRYPNQSPTQGIDCPKYQPCAGSKRCQHYLDGGACALATEFMCVEWLKRNGGIVPQDHPTRSMPPEQSALLPTASPAAPEPSQRTVRAPVTSEPPLATHARAPISPEELESFKALGVELRLDLHEAGPVWLVPRYTGQARKEITPEHAATLRLLLDAFPGARIAAFEKVAALRGKEAQA